MTNIIEIQNDSKLSPGDKQLLIAYINEYPIDVDKKNRAIATLGDIKFDPNYESKFTGNLFTGMDAKYFQARDKIDAYFKYGDNIIEGVMMEGGRRSKRRRSNRRKTNKRRHSNRRRY